MSDQHPLLDMSSTLKMQRSKFCKKKERCDIDLEVIFNVIF